MENAGQCLRGRADAGQQRVGGSLFGNGSEFSQEKLLALEHPVFVISALASSSYFFFFLGVLLWASKSILKDLS